MEWGTPLEKLNQAFSQIRRPVSVAGFYSDGFHPCRADALEADRPRPSSQLNISWRAVASNEQPEIAPKQKLMLYLGTKRLSSAALKPTSLHLDSTGMFSPQSLSVLSPTTSDLSVASRASTERMDGHRDYLISSRRARMAAEADLQVSFL